ncbi:hypothetical protein [Erythrobacter crassostreae]|uniref:Uncharacterized protein n=1 Tax=Erythrobacter crassostreae TaxID=2828328 RepID=A0A9X1F5B5_9SPHN|nr:hypothetical protein [Erythrobacter crassostrea]MBV7259783.1 hypothetical protein [Erythrobacter crassostrea]
MTRKLFAFLAMLSGLAALGGTATASYAHPASSCNTSVSAAAENASADHATQSTRDPGKAAKRKKGCRAKKPMPMPRSMRVPVLMGIDRAYE